MTDDEYQALWSAYDQQVAAWREALASRGTLKCWEIGASPERPMVSRRKVRDAAHMAWVRTIRATVDRNQALFAALDVTMTMEPRWTASDALDHFRRFVQSGLPQIDLPAEWHPRSAVDSRVESNSEPWPGSYVGQKRRRAAKPRWD